MTSQPFTTCVGTSSRRWPPSLRDDGRTPSEPGCLNWPCVQNPGRNPQTPDALGRARLPVQARLYRKEKPRQLEQPTKAT